MRHSFVTQIIKATRDIQKLARHPDIKTTMGYAHSVEADLVEAVNKLM